MVLKTKKEKKALVADAVDQRPKPYWEGEEEIVPYLTSKDFLKAFKKLRVRDTAYIKTKDVQEFLNIFFGDSDSQENEAIYLTKFIKTFVTYYTHSKARWVDLADMFRYLEPFLLPHAFSNVRGRLKYSSVDVMQIWTYYNDDHTDTMDGDEIMVFVFDMLQNPKQRCNPKIIDSLTAKLIELSGEEEVTLRGFSKLLPLEDSIMDQYKDITKLDRKATLRVLAFYDQNDEGSIDGCELYALIKDVLESNGHKDPYNMEVILEKQEYLKEVGCLTPSGALDYTKTDIVFALGTEKVSEEVA